MGDIVPRDQLTKQGWHGIAGIGGGVGLLILSAIASSGIVAGLIAGGIVGIAGLVITSSKEDRTAGLLAVGAGALTIVSAILRHALHFGGFLMPVAGVGLIAAGVVSLVRFLRNLRRRSQ